MSVSDCAQATASSTNTVTPRNMWLNSTACLLESRTRTTASRAADSQRTWP